MAISDREAELFRAISDHNRRRILKILGDRPGITINELCEEFPTSRFAVMKHLNVLEEVGLVRRERDGVSKHVYSQLEGLREGIEAFLRRIGA
jgi:DNA-binding transcriptional ArsR family regulator